MTIDFQSFLDSVKLFHVVILSTSAGYLLAAPASLRVWIATQKTTSLPPQGDGMKTWKKWAIACATLTVLLGLEYAIFFHATARVFNNVILAVLGYFVFSSCAALFLSLTGTIKWGIHRNNRGVPIPTVVRQKRNWKQTSVLWAGLLGSIAISVGTLATNHQALVAVASTALVFNMSRRAGFKSMSLRWMIIGLLGWIAGSLLVCAGLVFYLASKERSSNNDSNNFLSKPNTLDEVWTHERSWVFPPIYAFIPGMFIALCLRFDYQRHLDNSATVASEFILCAVSAPEPRRGRKQMLGEGIVVPSHAPTAFSKVYYTTAFVAWGITQLGIVCINAFTRLSLEGPYEFAGLALIAEIPIMCLAVIAVAMVRGEWKTLWRYREVWIIKPVAKKIVLSETAPLILKE